MSLVGDSFQYLIGLTLMGLANMVLLPLYTRFLSVAELGSYALIEVVLFSSIAIAGLGSNVSYLKWFAENDSTNVPTLLGTTLWTNGVAALAIGVALAGAISSGAGMRVLGTSTRSFAFAIVPLILFETEENALLNHLRGCRRPIAFSIASIVRLISIAGFSVWLMAVRHSGLAGLFWGRVLGNACELFMLACFLSATLSVRFSWKVGLSMARYGLPVVGGTVAMMAMDGAGRYFISVYATLQQVGLFLVGIKIAGLMRVLFVAPFGAAWGALIFQIEKEQYAQFIYSKLLGYIFLLAMAFAAILSLVAPVLLRIFATASYNGSLKVIPLLLLVQVFVAMQYPASVGIYLGRDTKWLAATYIVGLIVDATLNRILVPDHGMVGAAAAWIAGWFTIISLTFVAGQKQYPLNFERKPIFAAIIVWFFALGILDLPTGPAWYLALVRTVACIAIGGSVASYLAWDVRRSRWGMGETATR